jgi:CRP/FNR family transcriptional regulator, cyclic AMP receptor protein
MNKISPEVIKNTLFFKHLSDEDLLFVTQNITLRSYTKGEILFMEGERGEALHILFEGLIKLSKLSEEGKEQILHYVHPGGIFAEVVLFDGGPYPATAEAAEDSLVGLLSNSDMEKMVLSNNTLALGLLKILSRRLRAAQLVIRDLALHDADKRLSRLLLRLSERHGVDTSKGIKLDTMITREEMANIIGTTRETVARILSRFQKEGSILLDKGRIYLKKEFFDAIDEA